VVTKIAYELYVVILLLSKHVLHPVYKAYVIVLVEIYRELRSKPNLFDPITVTKNMINIFNFGITSMTQRTAINSSIGEVASHS
jgi:hypothetical protein